MLTSKEELLLPKVFKLMRFVRRSDTSAINCKECLRNLFEMELSSTKKEALEIQKQAGTISELLTNTEVVSAKLSLAVCALNGLKPKNSGRWQRDWTDAANRQVKHLAQLEKRSAFRTKEETNIYLLWTITQAIILADATDILHEWDAQTTALHDSEAEIQKLRKEKSKFLDETAQRRIRGKK